MAITPIDIQTLFAQLDKVGRTHASQREGQMIQQAVQGIQLQKKTDEEVQQVKEAQNTGEGVEKVKDRDSSDRQQQNKDKRNSEEQEEETDRQSSFFSDPSLGKKIDISL